MSLLDLVEIQIGEESTFGTEASTYSEYPGLVNKGGVKLKTESEEILITNIGSLNEAEEIVQGNKHYGLETTIRVQSLIFLYWLMGTLTSETGSNPYTHTIDPVVGNRPSCSIEVVINSDFSIKFLGSRLEKAVFKVANNAELQCTLSWICKSGSVDATPGNPSQLSTAIYKIAESNTFTINSANYLATCEKAEYTFFFPLNEDYGLSSLDPDEINEAGGRGCNAVFDIRIADETTFNLWVNDTEFAISHDIRRAGSANDKLVITIGEAKVSKPNLMIGNAGGAARINLPTKSSGDLQFTTIDAISTYSDPQ